MSLLFFDDLGFIAFRVLIKEIAKTLEKIEKIVLEWGEKNAVIYDMTKTEQVLLSYICHRCLNQQF